ncbi:unnamed protein product, partial [Brachionus calyciflorus]
ISSTLIDLFFHNGDLVDETCVVNCPFSDHKFVLANLLLIKPNSVSKIIECRSLSDSNLLKLCNFFNSFFTSISSSSNSSVKESSEFIQKQMSNLNPKKDQIFKFSFTTPKEIDELLTAIQTSSGP